MANFAENAALNSNKAVALFSLEMSEGELAQRFIASQASIKGDDLRKGRVPQARWGRSCRRSARLAHSKLYIDDSSDLSVLDVRAKARRLAQQNADGLGLILIDYLQLMRAGGSGPENRVEQIGQISRGLKTLARELEVPVIALSQLNRGVEQRKPPMPDALRPSRIRRDRAGRRPRDVHLPRGLLRQGVRARGDRRPDHRQAPQRRRSGRSS